MNRLKRRGAKDVEFLGAVDESQLRNVYARCRALLFAADEDFGMVPLEAQSYGRPVIAFGKGGSLETVVGAYDLSRQKKVEKGSALTGVFFAEQTAESLASAILSFESSEDRFVPEDIQLHARKFETSVFVERLRNYIEWVMAKGRDTLESKDGDRVFQPQPANLYDASYIIQ
jgi:glycosyltransferase involved in cell wall biosynthesis